VVWPTGTEEVTDSATVVVVASCDTAAVVGALVTEAPVSVASVVTVDSSVVVADAPPLDVPVWPLLDDAVVAVVTGAVVSTGTSSSDVGMVPVKVGFA